MLDLHAVKSQDLNTLSPMALADLASQMLAHIEAQSQHIDALDKQVGSQAQGIKWRDAKIESILFQLARLKAWRFGAKTERMNAEQRSIFEETFAADHASLQAQLEALQGSTPDGTPDADTAKDKKARKPKREPLPDHLPRVDTVIEPEDTHCPTPECRQPMARVGEDISERLDIVPAKFFVQRQIRGKWACKCCQLLLQEPAAAQVFDNALPTPGLQAHVAVSRFVDHIPYYRQETINARCGVHTPRSTLASWSGQTGAQLMPLYDAQRDFVLSSRVLHADETPVAMLDPGAGKTKKAYMWTYVRGVYDPQPGVVYDFRLGRGGKYASEFLKGWSGTLVVDAYAGYDKTLAMEGRSTAFCMAHARRKFDEIVDSSPVAVEAIRRIAWLYKVEAAARPLSADERLQMRLERSKPMWEQLHLWLQLERNRVPDGGGIAKAIDYSLKRWDGLGRFLLDGDVPLDNNHCENRIRPWAVGRVNWLFIGSELAGERAAVIASLLQSAKLCGHAPWAYLKDVLTRLPMQLNSRIEELLPHRWQPGG
ncbi:MAG: IS66 family transposase [Paucibacter sp.]|nr:IS66 family transposase [Roseateles sp.]